MKSLANRCFGRAQEMREKGKMFFKTTENTEDTEAKPVIEQNLQEQEKPEDIQNLTIILFDLPQQNLLSSQQIDRVNTLC